MTNKKSSICFKIVMLTIICLMPFITKAQKQTILYTPEDDGTVYTSLETALQDPAHVYRLKLTKLPSRDSLPEELFSLTELRELTIKGCRLCVLNQDIAKLKKLQYLNVDRNKLVRLPESIGALQDLRMMIISRNMIEILPNAISHLKQLATIDAWDNPMYVLPESITALSNTLKTLDLRQVALRRSELDAMEVLLPNTEILFTNICECENRRDHD